MALVRYMDVKVKTKQISHLGFSILSGLFSRRWYFPRLTPASLLPQPHHIRLLSQVVELFMAAIDGSPVS